jgi:pimeloyl-ACP methyl ester carboxylesterase
MVHTSFGQTHVRLSGPVDGPPVVLLPGAGHCSLMWIPNVGALSACHRVCAVDTLINTGCVGRSVFTRVIGGPGDAASWLDELLRGLDLRRSVNLAGMSYGGWLTAQYALRFPERLSGIVLVAPAATVLPVRLVFYLRALLPGFVHHPDVHRWFLRWAFSDLTKQKPEMLEDMVNHGLVAVQSFKPPDYGWRVPPTVLRDSELARIEVPAFFLVGENEVLYSPQQAVQRLNEVAPNVQTQIIANAGHDLTFVRPDIVNQEILGFLAHH